MFAEMYQDYLRKYVELKNGIPSHDTICRVMGKTMCGNGQKKKKANHIISAWSKEDGYCLGQKAVEEKSNEITAIPDLLDKIQIKGQIVTIDAMGTQIKILEKIRKKRADYVLALKGNQGTLYADVKEYFTDTEFIKKPGKKPTVR